MPNLLLSSLAAPLDAGSWWDLFRISGSGLLHIATFVLSNFSQTPASEDRNGRELSDVFLSGVVIAML